MGFVLCRISILLLFSSFVSACAYSTQNEQQYPPILLVHGAWHGKWCYEEFFIPYLTAAGFDVHTIDLPCHGEQFSGTQDIRFKSVEQYVDAVAEYARGWTNHLFWWGTPWVAISRNYISKGTIRRLPLPFCWHQHHQLASLLPFI